jgi:uncharacterized protein YjiS (DUF1127 family)
MGVAATERGPLPFTSVSAFGWQTGRWRKKLHCTENCEPAGNFTGVPPITDGSAELTYIDGGKRSCRAMERTMIAFGVGLTRWRRLPHWSAVTALFAEWRRRVRSRYELDRLSERDLADMGLTPLDAANEMQKPFWEA